MHRTDKDIVFDEQTEQYEPIVKNGSLTVREIYGV